MRRKLRRSFGSAGARGQTLTEYALILGFAMLVAATAVTTLGTNLSTYLNDIASFF